MLKRSLASNLNAAAHVREVEGSTADTAPAVP